MFKKKFVTNHFSLSNPGSNNDVRELIFRLIETMQKTNPVIVSDITFEFDDDGPKFTVYYNMKTRYRSEYSDVGVGPEKLATKELINSGINRLTLRLPQGREQGDIVKLLAYLASEIEHLDNSKILDILYDRYIDNDGNDHPFFVVYYLD